MWTATLTSGWSGPDHGGWRPTFQDDYEASYGCGWMQLDSVNPPNPAQLQVFVPTDEGRTAIEADVNYPSSGWELVVEDPPIEDLSATKGHGSRKPKE